MNRGRFLFASVTRISRLAELEPTVEPLPRDEWELGDYVVGEVVRVSRTQQVELATGRMIEIAEGDLIVGVLGKRHATLELVGNWEQVGPSGRIDLLTGAGLFGHCTSKSTLLLKPPHLRYVGHMRLDGEKSRMTDWVRPVPERAFHTPVVLLFGTSMSAGKTAAARIIIRQLKKAGLRIIGAKLTGAARYRDVLTMRDAGADHIFDFTDVGLPSTMGPADQYRAALRQLLARMASAEADVAVIELGASPMEPYNGQVAIDELGDNIRLKVLCAVDPYGVVGVMTAFGMRPDLVTGIASNTEAGVELVEKIAGVPAINVMRRQAIPELRVILREKLELEGSKS
jgi:hypothetical protein